MTSTANQLPDWVLEILKDAPPLLTRAACVSVVGDPRVIDLAVESGQLPTIQLRVSASSSRVQLRIPRLAFARWLTDRRCAPAVALYAQECSHCNGTGRCTGAGVEELKPA